VRASNMENANSQDYLEKIKIGVIENLRQTAHAPSVQMTDVPRTTIFGGTEEDDDILDDQDEDDHPDARITQRRNDKRIERDDEFDESDDEEIAATNGVRPQNGAPKQRNVISYGAADVDMDSGAASPQAPQPVDIIATLATEANAEVNAEVMEAKSRGLTGALENGETGPSNAPSRSHSRAGPDNEGDVEMEDSVTVPVAPIAIPTPQGPLSPAASVAATAEPVPAEPAELGTEEIVQQPPQ
jgi:histone deacetylase 1/2